MMIFKMAIALKISHVIGTFFIRDNISIKFPYNFKRISTFEFVSNTYAAHVKSISVDYLHVVFIL